MIYLKAQVLCDSDDCAASCDVLVRADLGARSPVVAKYPEGWLFQPRSNHTFCPDCTDRMNLGK